VIHTTADETVDQERQDQTNIKFPNNRLLIDLCGEFDKNLAEIEQRLTLQIVRRGNELNLLGDEISRSDAKLVLEALYTRLENGKSLDNGDLDRELREVIGGKDWNTSRKEISKLKCLKNPTLKLKLEKK
jgi:phosphate starvation-inducible PhoH-like protein